jgi:RNA polymerase sigma factor (sigma-70 family)
MARHTDSGLADAELVRRSLLGAKEPFAELVTRHWATAVALAARVLGSAELARDAAQEATVSALTGLDQLRSPERFGAWFCGIALNVSRRWLYQLRREIPGLQPDDLACADPGPAEIAAAKDLASRVRDAIATLPSGQRDAVLLFYLQGLSHREAAAELGTSAGAVKARLHQARTNLALRLSPLTDTPEGTTMNQADAPEWIDVSVAEVRRTDDASHPKHLMLLRERGGHRRLAIWIGPAEATAMVISLESVEHPRPMAYSLTASLLAAAGSSVREIRITRLTPPIYYATVLVAGPDGLQEVDARPSDAVNLALVAGVPIRADSRLFGDVQAEHYADALSYPTGTAELAAEFRQLQQDLLRERELPTWKPASGTTEALDTIQPAAKPL